MPIALQRACEQKRVIQTKTGQREESKTHTRDIMPPLSRAQHFQGVEILNESIQESGYASVVDVCKARCPAVCSSKVLGPGLELPTQIDIFAKVFCFPDMAQRIAASPSG
jgi:hypothetical protein